MQFPSHLRQSAESPRTSCTRHGALRRRGEINGMRSGETLPSRGGLAPSGGGFAPAPEIPHPSRNLRSRPPGHLRPSRGRDRPLLPQEHPQPPHTHPRTRQSHLRLARERPLQSHLRPQHPQSSPSTCRSCQEVAHPSPSRGHSCHAMSSDRLAHDHLRHVSSTTHPRACPRNSTHSISS